jgi:hypothetical protein
MKTPTLKTLLLGLLVATALATMPGASASNPHVEPNQGTIKIHDDATADPPQRNIPHVTCDFWVEGFNMADATGTLVFYSWPPTGNMTVVMVANFTGAPEGDQNGGFHFLEGAFFLEAGHYRVEAVGEDEQVMAKSKTFWVEPCETTVPHPCPGDLGATANPDGSITVSWDVPANATGVNLYRAVGDGDFEYVTTLTPDQDMYHDTNTTVGVVYSYYVTGLFGDVESNDCEAIEVTAIPNFPTAVLAGLGALVGIGAYAYFGRRKA